MQTSSTSARPSAEPSLQADFSSWAHATSEPSELVLGEPGFSHADLFDPLRLSDLSARFEEAFLAADPAAHATFAAYRACKGEGMTPEAISTALLAAAPHVTRFVAKLFRVEREVAAQHAAAEARHVVFEFKAGFAKKRLFKASAGKAWTRGDVDARRAAIASLASLGAARAVLGSGVSTRHGAAPDVPSEASDEEVAIAKFTLNLAEIDDVARKAAKAGGVTWNDDLRARARAVRNALSSEGGFDDATKIAGAEPADAELAAVVAFAMDAVEAWLARRRADHNDAAHHFPSLHAPKNIEFEQLVELRRPDAKMPELFVGPDDERRRRDGFELTDRRMDARDCEGEVDYCLYCHDRDKDSCSKGLREKSGGLKKNPLGVDLAGCPLDEKISEMHVARQKGDAIAALALVCIDNPMVPGTGHRICNDCMKACVFQKQEPVNIPQIETGVLTDALALPWGFEIYGLLTRWNPLDVRRPHALPYNGKNVLVVGLGPAGYTLAHHLACEGFAVAGIDGLKIEPLPVELTGDANHAPRPIKDFERLYIELDERVLLGFGGVSEYGITVRWDKNFLTVLYITLARNRLFRVYDGVRFGGTVELEDAWKLGFDHVAIAAGAGRPTIIPLKNNIARGIRKASDFLMALQLTGAYKRSSLANLQVRLPAIVIGGGLTAIDTATELIAYYAIQAEKTAERLHVLFAERGRDTVLAMFDAEEKEFLEEQLVHAAAIREERERAKKQGEQPNLQALIDGWGGVSLVYRKRVLDSPAYRLNHEEVIKSLEEGVRYIENMAPTEAVLDERGAVKALRFDRQGLIDGKWKSSGEIVEMPAKTVCVAAGTSPNVTYEKEHPGSFQFDDRKQFFRAHKATVDAEGHVSVTPTTDLAKGFFTSYCDGKHAVSFYGDNHPHFAGSVVKAMASAKHAYPSVVALFERDIARLGEEPQRARDERRKALFARLDDEWRPRVERVERLTPTIVEVVVRAPAAARRFHPGQFYRLQNYEVFSHVVQGTRLAMEGIALTGAWVDKGEGLLSMIALEMGTSSRLLATLKPGQPVVVMGPTGAPTEIPTRETVLLAGGGLGNAVLFSIAKALRENGAHVLYFAGYKKGEDLFKQDEIEAATDQVIWCTDTGIELAPRRKQDRHFRGNIVQAMLAYAEHRFSGELFSLQQVSRIIAIGSDRMMNAVREARHGVLAPHLDPKHLGIASINSPMQCMMKEVCAQCLQRHVDPVTGKETIVFTCMNQDQELDRVDFENLRARLRANSAQEKIANVWLDRLFAAAPDLPRI